MLTLLLVIAIVFSAVWGTVYLKTQIGMGGRRLDYGEDEMIHLLRETVDSLESRLSRMEEEMDFLRQLNTPVDPPLLPPSDSVPPPSTDT